MLALQLSYVGEDELDRSLEHWQIPAVNNQESSMSAALVIVSLDINGQRIRSAITKRSYIDMNIQKDDTLFAIFKAL